MPSTFDSTRAMTLPMRRFDASRCDFTSFVGLIACGLLPLLLIGCQEGPKVSTLGEAVETGGMEINVSSYGVRRLEVDSGDRTYAYPDPVLAITFELTNEGKGSFMYSPTHGAKRMTESTTPLLYPAPGKNKPLPPDSKSPIKGVFLEKGHLDEQVTQSTSLESGESIRDVMLYEVPSDEKKDLVFSVPPTMHRGDKPVLFRIPYEYSEPEGPTVHSKGEAIDLDGVAFTVTSAEHAYIETKHPEKNKGYSNEPLFRVEYEIANDSDESIAYVPGHSVEAGQRAEMLYADGTSIGRVTFKTSDRIPGWITEKTTVEAGETIEDMAIFESPGKDVESLRFEFPASRIGRNGLIRVELPYDREMPDKPDPLKSDEDEDEG